MTTITTRTPLERAMATVMAAGHVPGASLAVVRHDRLVFAAGFGVADVASGRPTTCDTQHLWFSMSKIATATAAMALAAEGRLDLDAPIAAFGLAIGGPVSPTVRQLLSHTAGFANPVPLRWVRPVDAPAPDPGAFLARLLRRHGRPKHPVGGPARYSNLGYVVLGEVIARAAGERVESVVRSRVLEPAGMAGTGYAWSPGAPHATGYINSPAVLAPVLRAALPSGIVGRRQGRWQSFRPFLVDGAAYGGLVGDAVDAARLARLHLGDGQIDGRRVLPAEAARSMRTIVAPGRPYDLGLGWFREAGTDGGFVQHLGGGGGYFDVMRIYPELDLGLVLMTNATKHCDYGAVCDAVVATFGS